MFRVSARVTIPDAAACVDGPAMNAGRILWDRWGVQEAEATPPEGFPALAGWPG